MCVSGLNFVTGFWFYGFNFFAILLYYSCFIVILPCFIGMACHLTVLHVIVKVISWEEWAYERHSESS